MDTKIIEKFACTMKNTKMSPSDMLKNRVLSEIKNVDLSIEKVSPFRPPYLKPVFVAAYTVLFLVGGWFLNEQFRKETVNVTFVLYHESAREIHLTGDFNEWDKDSISMEEKNGYWSTMVSMKPGVYQYMFVIDGEKWIPDPSNTAIVESAFGGVNSVLEVQES